MNPTVELPPRTPLTSQVTAWFVVPPTLAVNDCVFSSSTLAGEGVIKTIMTELIVTFTEAVFDGSATLVAVMVTVLGEGATRGAV